MTSRYAEGTSVSAERSKVEIERTLMRYGADDFVTGTSRAMRQAFVAFSYKALPVRMVLPLPDPEAAVFTMSPSGKRERTPEQARAAWEKACRQQWRVLLLLIKANLEAIENGVVSAEAAFLPWLLLAGGRTVYEEMKPGIQKAVEGKTPLALPWGESTK